MVQVFQPWIQKRKLAYVKHKHVISGILKDLKARSVGRLLTDKGQPDVEVIKSSGPHTTDVINDFHQQIKQEHYLLGDISDEAAEAMENSKWISNNAASMLHSGPLLQLHLHPLVDSVTFLCATSYLHSSSHSCSPPLLIQVRHYQKFASRKTQKTASLTFSEIWLWRNKACFDGLYPTAKGVLNVIMDLKETPVKVPCMLNTVEEWVLAQQFRFASVPKKPLRLHLGGSSLPPQG
ncbi:hypothetical protein NE237_000897 [Protea cynaroides]|uniref:Uncharacterized protein n=1 Tax=Protea cynaroides TaxID=273540 RepID=A0A9Q0KSB9_9MAGN|nr:hypothetical protein NE237_000897 [Protea cynaroides]